MLSRKCATELYPPFWMKPSLQRNCIELKADGFAFGFGPTSGDLGLRQGCTAGRQGEGQ